MITDTGGKMLSNTKSRLKLLTKNPLLEDQWNSGSVSRSFKVLHAALRMQAFKKG
jgi:hypothetical protein